MEQTICADPECNRPREVRGLCDRHYRRARRSGDLVPVASPNPRIADIDLGSRTCTCQVHGSHSPLRVREGRKPVCQSCDRGSKGRRGPHDPEKRREERLHRKYGITIEEYQIRHEAQQGRCLICGTQRERLVVDHCHVRGHVRGLLCNECNLGLGYFRDIPCALKVAAEYVRRYRLDVA